MSNFHIIAEEMINDLRFEEECKDGIGRLTIYGLSFPEFKDFGPLDKIWSSVRKRNAELYGIYTTAIFAPDNGSIKGEFYPNCAIIDERDSKQYVRRFEETFPQQMLLFYDAIQSFIIDQEFGYIAYCEYLEKAGENAKPEECRAIVDAFLRRYNFKTAKDDLEKKRREARSKEILKLRMKEISKLIRFQ